METNGDAGRRARRERHSDRICVGILSEGRYLAQAQPVGLRDALLAAGHQVRLIDADAQVHALGDSSWLADLDVVVARGRSWSVLALLATAEAWGLATVNPRAAVAAVHNKAEMAVALTAAGILVPATLLGTPARLAAEVPGSGYPLIVKPIFGDNGRGLRVVGSRAELLQVVPSDALILAQRFLPSDGWDLKLYGIGAEIRAVRKRSPLFGASREPAAAEPLPLTPALARLGRSCGTLFGLELFGVDCVETPRGPAVIEVNEFPNYSGVEGASELLAAYLAARAPRAGEAA